MTPHASRPPAPREAPSLAWAIVFLGVTNLVLIFVWLGTIYGALGGLWLAGR